MFIESTAVSPVSVFIHFFVLGVDYLILFLAVLTYIGVHTRLYDVVVLIKDVGH